MMVLFSVRRARRRSRAMRVVAVAVVTAPVLNGASLGGSAPIAVADDPGEIRITEWMYAGPGGEWVELTNVGGGPVNFAGWSYDDDSADPGGFDLSGFGVVAPGESVVFTESDVEAFRNEWGLCAEAKVLGSYTNNLARRSDQHLRRHRRTGRPLVLR